MRCDYLPSHLLTLAWFLVIHACAALSGSMCCPAIIQATGIPPSNSLESAIVTTLANGSYTAIVSGYHDATGVGLVEVYNLQ